MGSQKDTVLEVSDLGVAIDGQCVLEHVSFVVKRGEILTILGPNGAGKTQLLRTLLGILPHTGTISWAKGARIGYVPQRLPYVREIPVSIEDFFALKQQLRANVPEKLRAVGLDERLATHSMGELSSGQFQRVLIAWALSGDPDVLLFDEPTAGIDIGGEETVYRLLSRVHRERNLTMLLVTHDLVVVNEFSSMVLCLNKRPVCLGPPLEVLTPETLQKMYGAGVRFHQHAAD